MRKTAAATVKVKQKSRICEAKMENKTIKSAFESMMFIWGEPLAAKTAGEVFNISEKEAVTVFEELRREYEDRESGIRIRRVDKSYQIVTAEENAEYI